MADRVTRKNKGMVSELPLTISAQDGLISQDEFFNKKVASKDLSSYLLLYHGDFAYNKSYSNGYPFGTIKRLEKYTQGVVSSLYIAFKPNSRISSDFMAQYYESNNWHKEIYKCAAEGARNHGLLNVAPSDFFATDLNIPITKSEQLKIGRLLNAVDHTITLHEGKKRQLELLKSALLQKMFADENGYPSVRFREFSDVWQLKKFKEVYAKSKEKNTRYGIQDIISVANMHYNKNASIRSVEYLKTYNVFKIGDIAFEGNKSSRFSHGRFVENTIGDGIVSHVFDVFRPIDKHDLQFMKHYINCENVMGPIMLRVTKASTMMTNLVAKDFLNESIRIPSISEQQHIGRLLECLNQLITMHQNKLNNLKILKNSLLQNMFI
ncbi:restriction endonuclease subunit S [Lactobacillus delbrueckii]|uniref:restriction endonuclease subunit S n=1 Tax=Lactobacillus delbrueckii TaxID=1584 RepID=UPI003A894028